MHTYFRSPPTGPSYLFIAHSPHESSPRHIHLFTVPKWLCFCFAYTAVTLTLSYSNFSLSLCLFLYFFLFFPPFLLHHTPHHQFQSFGLPQPSRLPSFLFFLPYLHSYSPRGLLTVLSEVYLLWSLVVSRLGPILEGVDRDLQDILRLIVLSLRLFLDTRLTLSTPLREPVLAPLFISHPSLHFPNLFA